MFAHVKLEQDENREYVRKLTVNGVDFSKNTCRVELEAQSIPKVIITMNGAVPEFDGQADVKFDFPQDAVQQAIVVLRNELLKHGEVYDGFVESIASVLYPMERYFDGDGTFKINADRGAHSLALEIMDRIIGEE